MYEVEDSYTYNLYTTFSTLETASYGNKSKRLGPSFIMNRDIKKHHINCDLVKRGKMFSKGVTTLLSISISPKPVDEIQSGYLHFICLTKLGQ